MTVTLDSNIKGISYLDVSNQVMDELQLDDIERDHTMFVMPDSVDFGIGAAYGETFGPISWFMSFVASYPIIQVRTTSYGAAVVEALFSASVYLIETRK